MQLLFFLCAAVCILLISSHHLFHFWETRAQRTLIVRRAGLSMKCSCFSCVLCFKHNNIRKLSKGRRHRWSAAAALVSSIWCHLVSDTMCLSRLHSNPKAARITHFLLHMDWAPVNFNVKCVHNENHTLKSPLTHGLSQAIQQVNFICTRRKASTPRSLLTYTMYLISSSCNFSSSTPSPCPCSCPRPCPPTVVLIPKLKLKLPSEPWWWFSEESFK